MKKNHRVKIIGRAERAFLLFEDASIGRMLMHRLFVWLKPRLGEEAPTQSDLHNAWSAVHMLVTKDVPELISAFAERARVDDENRQDAARWRALLRSGRIRVVGTGSEGTPAMHMGVEFWMTFTPELLSATDQASIEAARKTLIQYVDDLRKFEREARQATPTPEVQDEQLEG